MIQSIRSAAAAITTDSLTTFMIPVAKVTRTANHRKHSQAAIQAMAENIDVHGHRQPIEVLIDGDSYQLIFGALRLDAIAYLGRSEIKAEVKRREDFASGAAIRLVTISENMARRELSVLERSLDIADWCEIYRAAQPGIKPGRKPAAAARGELGINLILNSPDTELMAASGQFAASFSDAAQAFLGVSRAGVFRALKIASIDALQRDRIALEPIADNQAELMALAAQATARQAAIIDLILGGKASSVADAMAALDERPRHIQAAWEKFSEQFARIAEPEQDRFFDLNEPAIARWQAKKGK